MWGVSGADGAAPIWRVVMDTLHKGKSAAALPAVKLGKAPAFRAVVEDVGGQGDGAPGSADGFQHGREGLDAVEEGDQAVALLRRLVRDRVHQASQREQVEVLVFKDSGEGFSAFSASSST